MNLFSALFAPRRLVVLESRTRRPLRADRIYRLRRGGSVQVLRVKYPSATDSLSRVLLRFADALSPRYVWRRCSIEGGRCYVAIPELASE